MIGIDISDRSIKVAEVTDERNPELRTLGWSSMPAYVMHKGIIKDVPAVRESLRRAMGAAAPHRVQGIDVTASISEIQSFVKVLEVPKMGEDETDEAVRWAVRKHIPFDLERVYMDWEEIRSKRTTREVLVGMAQRNVVDPLLGVIDDFDLSVVALELEAQAVMRCLLPMDAREAQGIRGVLVIDLGATSSNALLYDQGAMQFTTSIAVGGDDLTKQLASDLGVTVEQAIKLKENIGDKDKAGDPGVAKSLQAGALNLVKKIELATRDMLIQLAAGQEMKVILLTGGSANLEGITSVFSQVFVDVPVQMGNPWTNVHKNKLSLTTGDAMHFTTAIGLALRPRE